MDIQVCFSVNRMGDKGRAGDPENQFSFLGGVLPGDTTPMEIT